MKYQKISNDQIKIKDVISKFNHEAYGGVSQREYMKDQGGLVKQSSSAFKNERLPIKGKVSG